MFCSITLVPCCKWNECFGIFVFCIGFSLFTLSIRLVLWSNNNVVTAIKLCNCFKVTIGIMVKSHFDIEVLASDQKNPNLINFSLCL